MGKRTASHAAVVALFGVLITANCGGGSGTNGASEAQHSQPAAQAASAAVDKDNPCTLLTSEQVAEAVGMKPSLREVVDDVTCSYEFEPPPESESASKSAPPGKAEDDPEAIAKAFTVGATGGAPKLSWMIHWEDGKTAVAATRMAGQMMGGANSGFTKLEGIGDEAWLGPLASTLIVLKGSVAVELDMRLLPEGNERGPRLARAIVSRL